MDRELLIAVVDDEPTLRTSLGRMLRLANYRVAAFASGEEFLLSLQSDGSARPACAILDIHMPGLDGFELRSRMRAAQIGIPVVFITASDDLALDRRALAADAASLLRKPFATAELLSAIGKALSAPGAAGT